MELIADILLVAGTCGVAFYCYVLGRKVNRFNDLEKGIGGAVAVLSSQVEELKQTLDVAQTTAAGSSEMLSDLNVRAESLAKRLEIQIAALNDLPHLQSGEDDPEDIISAPQPSNQTNPQSEIVEPMFVRRTIGAT